MGADDYQRLVPKAIRQADPNALSADTHMNHQAHGLVSERLRAFRSCRLGGRRPCAYPAVFRVCRANIDGRQGGQGQDQYSELLSHSVSTLRSEARPSERQEAAVDGSSQCTMPNSPEEPNDRTTGRARRAARILEKD